MALVLCPECNKEFDNKKYYVNGDGVYLYNKITYCCKKCCHDAITKYKEEIITCKHCKKEFARKDGGSRMPVFCSEQCRINYRKENLAGENKNCIICGTQFYASPVDKERNKRCCSADCRNKYLKLNPPNSRVMRRLYNTDYVKLYVGDVHPRADRSGYVPEHVLVIEKSIGRYLTDLEVVHHVNYVHGDNRLENLMLFPTEKDHHQYHYKTDPRYAARIEKQKKFRYFNCDCCKKEVLIKNIAQYNRTKNHYCSPECKSKGRQKRITVNCLHCHKDFEVQEYRKNEVKYCSNACKIYGSALKRLEK